MNLTASSLLFTNKGHRVLSGQNFDQTNERLRINKSRTHTYSATNKKNVKPLKPNQHIKTK